jgi:hypothetical protein
MRGILAVFSLVGLTIGATFAAPTKNVPMINLGSGQSGSGIGLDGRFAIEVRDTNGAWVAASNGADAATLTRTAAEPSRIVFTTAVRSTNPNISASVMPTIVHPDGPSEADPWLRYTIAMGQSVLIENGSEGEFNALADRATTVAPGEVTEVTVEVSIAPGAPGTVAAATAPTVGLLFEGATL